MTTDAVQAQLHATYTFDPRVDALLARAATVILSGASGDAVDPSDFVAVLLELEWLRVAASYTEAGVAFDDPPLSDPAGRAVVAAMWEALNADLADGAWERRVAAWRATVDE